MTTKYHQHTLTLLENPKNLDILTIVCKKVLKLFSHWTALILYFSTKQLWASLMMICLRLCYYSCFVPHWLPWYIVHCVAYDRKYLLVTLSKVNLWLSRSWCWWHFYPLPGLGSEAKGTFSWWGLQRWSFWW